MVTPLHYCSWGEIKKEKEQSGIFGHLPELHPKKWSITFLGIYHRLNPQEKKTGAIPAVHFLLLQSGGGYL